MHFATAVEFGSMLLTLKIAVPLAVATLPALPPWLSCSSTVLVPNVLLGLVVLTVHAASDVIVAAPPRATTNATDSIALRPRVSSGARCVPRQRRGCRRPVLVTIIPCRRCHRRRWHRRHLTAGSARPNAT